MATHLANTNNFSDAAVRASFEDVDKLIWQQCHWYVRTYGGDIEEAKSSANESFMIAFNRWEPSNGMAFSTYVRKVVRDRFLDEIRRKAIRSARENQNPIGFEMDEVEERSTVEYRFETEDANIVFKYITTDLSDSIKLKRQPETRRQLIVDYFVREFWWEVERVETALNHIEESL